MKHIFTFLAVCALVASTQGQDTTRVLFLGNSYTYYNDLPQLLTDLAADMGHVVETASNTPGGYTLQDHASNDTSLDLIAEGDWDFVVLQEQSQIPSFPDFQVEADFFPAAEYLVNFIRDNNDCAIPLFYMTWGREEGDAQNCDNWPPVCTYEGMQELLTNNYLETCDLNTSWCAPVGVVWEDVFLGTSIEVFDEDGSHPSLAGSYLAASTLFVAMFGENPSISVFDAGLDFDDSQVIDNAVWDVWQDAPGFWRQYELIQASLDIEEGPFGYTIEVSTSSYVDSVVVNTGSQEFVWQDGDVNQLFLTETTYLDYVAYSSCTQAVSYLDSVVIEGSINVNELDEQGWKIFPNPLSDVLRIQPESSSNATVQLLNMTGAVVREDQLRGPQLVWDVAELPAGVYLVEVWENGARLGANRVVIRR
ncbi:MAG: T9SS type A sorting domain-containing protein [Flavobacteriales bacterium]